MQDITELTCSVTLHPILTIPADIKVVFIDSRSEEHTSELQSRPHLVCRLLLEKKKATEDLKDDEKDLQKTYIGINDFMKSDYPLESVTSKKAS